MSAFLRRPSRFTILLITIFVAGFVILWVLHDRQVRKVAEALSHSSETAPAP